jgi:hypothetical protein
VVSYKYRDVSEERKQNFISIHGITYQNNINNAIVFYLSGNLTSTGEQTMS